MIDVVYPLKAESGNDFIELRYSLRSIERFSLTDVRVWVITATPPDWLQRAGIIWQGDDVGTPKRVVTTRKLWSYATSINATETWVLSCDDFYLCRPVDLGQLPLLAGDDLRVAAARFRHSPHKSNKIARVWDRTADIATWAGIGTASFEHHAPMRVVNSLWLTTPGMALMDQEIQPQSLYGNWAAEFGEPVEVGLDLKFWRRGHDEQNPTFAGRVDWEERTRDRWSWSTNDCTLSMPGMRELLEEEFPQPSRWER